jgi:hypothetical protein
MTKKDGRFPTTSDSGRFSALCRGLLREFGNSKIKLLATHFTNMMIGDERDEEMLNDLTRV